ncbi:uncharacterized protein LOC113515545 [Galleria mellonella]|uniref:Uncharacterized protein LOC113515545 n=1 Tax=Galleria mellonella TaxID=7137 RepID=A0A6J1WLF0_GALME|nr:uncharacterized protein LOC113515545 [Galleria mellonella]
MWKLLQKDPSFFIMFSSSNDYEVLVTNYITLWISNFNKTSFLANLKNSNELEIEDNSFIEKGLQMLSDTSTLKSIQINHEGTTLILNMVKSFGYSVKLNLRLKEASKELFFQKITQPLLEIIDDLKKSENKLRYWLKKKEHLRGKYDDENHMKNHQKYEDTFGDFQVPECLLQKICSIPHTNNIIKEENEGIRGNQLNANIKSEPDSQSNSQSLSITNTINVKKEIIKTETDASHNTKRKRKNLDFL